MSTKTTEVTAPGAALPDRLELSPARRRLFQVALGLMSRDGYHGVSVRDIVKELDQHPTAIYAHVSSKQELVFELVRIAHEELRDRIREALLSTGSAPAEQLAAVVSTNVLTHLAYPELARVAHSEHDRLSDEQRAVIDVHATELGRLLRDVVARGVEQGVFHPCDAEVTVLAIMTMGTRAVDWWRAERGIAASHVAATHAELALRMLGA